MTWRRWNNDQRQLLDGPVRFWIPRVARPWVARTTAEERPELRRLAHSSEDGK
jgi:hypothetical protein